MSPELDRRQLLASALALFPAARWIAQAPQVTSPPPTFSADVKVVNVFATVRDKEGQLVKGLTKDDFVLEEDDRPQVIRYFAQQSDLPLTLGLLVDTSGSERRMLGAERQASEKFFEQVLRPEKDKAFLIHFDREVELLQDLTSSRERLEKALVLLSTSQPDRQTAGGNGPSGGNGSQGQGGGGGWPGGGQGGRRRAGGYGAHGGTKLYDAVLLASDELMAKQTGRKAIILLTDGEDHGSKTPLEQAIGSARRADTLAYSVRIADQNRGGFGSPGMGGHGGWGGPGGRGGFTRPDGRKILRQISKGTGGGYFEVSQKKSGDDIYAEIEDELRNQYSLGYTPEHSLSEAGYRKIQLTVKQKGAVVQTREGYYAGQATESFLWSKPPGQSAMQRLNR
jgi:VWFA-related protein